MSKETEEKNQPKPRQGASDEEAVKEKEEDLEGVAGGALYQSWQADGYSTADGYSASDAIKSGDDTAKRGVDKLSRG